MSANPKNDASSLGTGRVGTQNTQVPSLSAGEVIGLVLSALWLVGCVLFFLVMGVGEGSPGGLSDPLRFVMTVVAIVMPVAVIWVAVAAMRSARIMREESARLKSAIDAMRSA